MNRRLIVFFMVSLSIFCSGISYSSVTTFDGAITLDLYEDTQSGDGRWILDFTVNGTIEPSPDSVYFSLKSTNMSINFYNQYNNLDSNYFGITEYSLVDENGLPMVFQQYIYTDSTDLPTPEGTMFRFYALPSQQGEPIIGTFNLLLGWGSSHNNLASQNIQLTGPIGFAAVPEPAGMCLFALGAFFLKFLIKRK